MPFLSNDFTIEQVKNILQKDLPQLKIETITLLDNGWDNAAFDVNGEYIFRFPKDQEAGHFEVELKLLDFLRGKTTTPIPDVQFVGKEISYMGYRKLRGQDLTPELYNSMTKEQRGQLAADYARFAFEIHNALTVEQAEQMGVNREDSFKNVPAIEAMLVADKIPDPDILAFAQEPVREYTETVNENEILSFIYGDLHTENIAFDPVTKRLNGIFDFGDSCIADIHFEFAPIYKFSTELLENAVRKYEEMAGVKLSLRKIVLRGRMNELGDLSEFIDQPESEIYQKATTRMAVWMKEKDIYKETKTLMSAEDVVKFYKECENLGIQIWVDGGWCVDALLEKQTRPHSDLDVAIEKKHIKQVHQLLESRGWKIVPRDDTTEYNYHLGDAKGREIDFHVIVLDEKGNGIYGPPENGVMYPADSLTGTGKIGDQGVKCISPEWMVKFHSGYELKEKDFKDVSALCEKFGIKLPEEYAKFKK